MRLAGKFAIPIITFIDTGAFPASKANNHVAEAIAVNLHEMFRLPVPIISIVIGEGGSGGASASASPTASSSSNTPTTPSSPRRLRHPLEKSRTRRHRRRRTQTDAPTSSTCASWTVIPNPERPDPAAAAEAVRAAIVKHLAQFKTSPPPPSSIGADKFRDMAFSRGPIPP